ncbi:MAG: hypothetical protein AAF772_13845, partial [Acidobacteriota bacterium]
MRRLARALVAALALVVALAAPLGAQAEADDGSAPGLLSSLGNRPEAMDALRMVEEGRYVGARERAEALLRVNADDLAGHALLGIILHRGETNLPRALFHLQRARALYELRYGETPETGTPYAWHLLALVELAYVHGAMGNHEDKLSHLRDLEIYYGRFSPAEAGWPLMRLRRYDEARAAAEAGLATDDPDQILIAQTALCAIEAEQHRRMASYAACSAAADFAAFQGSDAPTAFTNAAESAFGVLRFDEAETRLMEATRRFAVGTVANPWLDLLELYTGAGRTAEAADALRGMLGWRDRQPLFVDEQNRAEIEMASALLLLVAGRGGDAVTLGERMLARPDRTGFTSSEGVQMTAAAALLAHRAHALAATRLEEEASWSRLGDAVGLRARALRHRLSSWLAGRRAAAAFTESRLLYASLRPHLAGSIEISEWIKPALVPLLGPGVVSEALRHVRPLEADLPMAAAYFDLFAAEVAAIRGWHDETVALAARALDGLPAAERLLQARAAARSAEAALA